MTRWYVCQLLQGVTSNGRVRGGALFKDLPANIVGCFLMGLVSWVPGEHNNPLIQALNKSYLTYLRTGYFGSLTTFASWNLQMVEMAYSGQMVSVVFGYFIGTSAAVSSLALGEHVIPLCSKLVQKASKKSRNPTSGGETGVPEGQGGSGALVMGYGTQNSPPSSMALPSPLAPAAWHLWVPWAVDAAHGAILSTITAYSLYAFIQWDSSMGPRGLWASIMLGPVGALLRWQLSRFNPPVASYVCWFPWGTFAANMLGCLLDLVVASVLLRQPSHPLGNALAQGLITGLGGCLSTVSTWTVELQKLLVVEAHVPRGYVYVLASFVGAMLLSIPTYGVAVWTMQ